MNQNYVRKCEEYLQNIPSQKLTAAAATAAGPNLSSRKFTQKPGPPAGSLRRGQGRQSINNPPPPVPPPAEGSRPKPRPPVPQTPTSVGRRIPFRSPTVGSAGQQQQQQGSKFIRPCCRPKGAGGGRGGAAVGRTGSDNVNQNDDDVRMMDETVGGGGEGTAERKTKTWDGLLAKASVAESVEASLTEIKSKAHSPSPSDLAPITSTFPKGAVPDHPLVPNPSVTSMSTTVTSTSVRPASSSVAAVPPQPRLPSSNTERVPRKQPSSTSTTAEAPENHRQLQLQGINLFRFDPLRTLQFLTLELKSKLKPLLTTTTSASDGTSVHKQLYKISKELLYAVKILTENAQSQQQPAASRDKATSDGKISSKPPICGDSEVSLECQNCLKLQNALDRLREELPRKEINYLQDPPPEDSSKASTATDQLQLRLEGEIKRLQTMISDKQTATAEGLISDLNRKLDEATHARDEAQRKLLYATLENERLNFLLHSQCSTMANLRNDFSAIQSLADQQIDLLDQTTHGNVDDSLNNPHRSRSKSNTLAFGGNHHRNYRYPSGPTLATASERVVKLRPHHHYSFQNIAEKESDGTNDANDCYSPRNSQPQEPEVMLPSSPLFVGRTDAFQKQKNRVMNEEVERERGTAEPSSSLSEMNSARSGRFGPTKRALLIDSDRDDSLEKYLEGSQQQQSSSSSSSLSSLTSSQQQQQQLQRHRGHERNEPRTTTIGDNRREPPPPAAALGDKPFTTNDDTENFPGYTNNNNKHHRHIQNSKTNDCVSLAPGIDGMATNRQQLGPGAGSKKDTLPVLTTTTTAKGKYPRDYGDKFERRESLLAGAEMEPESGLEEKELCQNRPIMGQIRSIEGNDGNGEEVVLVGKIISDDANEPASGQIRRKTTTTEEFSIDFDDITLPSSPIPFRGRGRDEFPSSASFGDCWM